MSIIKLRSARMIHFKITLLLSLKVESRKSHDKRHSLHNEVAPIDDNSNDYELKIGEFIASFRIDYEMIPKRIKYSVDVVCWRNVSKISSPDKSRYYRVLEVGGHIWILIPIHHFLKELTEDELMSLHSNSILFGVIPSKKEITSKISRLYCLEKNVNKEEFVEYFEADPNKPENIQARLDETAELSQIANKCRTSGGITSWIIFAGKTQRSLVYDSIASIENGKEIRCKNLSSPSEPQTDKKRENKSKIKNRNDEKGDPHFIVPGEVFFTDPSSAVYRLKDANATLDSGYIFLSVDNLMIRKQEMSLNPFIVKINKLDCVPVEILQQNGYSKLFISYDIPFLAQYESSPKLISRTIYFHESHAYFTNNIPKNKYLEYLRTKKVKVEIKGIREEKQQEPKLFGSIKNDENFSKRLHVREAFHYLRKKNIPQEVQTLAIATYDLSVLLKNIWTFRLSAPCHHPENLLHGETENYTTQFSDILTIPEVNLANIDRQPNTSPLSNGILASQMTTLDMEFRFLGPQILDHHLRNKIRTFKRFFFTFFDMHKAKHLLASILQHNQNLIGLNAVICDPINFDENKIKIDLKKRKLSEQQKVSNVSLQTQLSGMTHDAEDVITGFMIDNGTEVHIFVEGISCGYILEVWNKVHKINPSVARVFLNSEVEFENRMYEHFLVVGVFMITLKKSLKKIFKNQSIYVRGLIPIPCFRALQKIRLLLQTETFSEMLIQELFPTTSELISLNIEFGVPMRLCKMN